MKLFDPKRTRHLIALLIAGAFLVPSFAWGINTVATGFKVETTDVRIDAHSNCHYVVSDTSTDWFVPTKSSAEWTAFLDNYSPSELSTYACGVPDNGCRVKYQHKTDQGNTPEGNTGYTDNTNTYSVGGWVKDRHGKDDHCDGSNKCGVRAGVQCTNTDYAIRITYEYWMGGSSAGIVTSPWSDNSTAFGAWSHKNYNGASGDQECPSSVGGCKLRMTVETNDPLVTCSIGYQHRIDNKTGNLAYDGAWSTFSHDTGDGENCEKSNGCGMVVRLYCDGPGGANSGGTGGTGGGTCGGGGTCSGATGSTCDPDNGNPGDGICSDGCCFDIGGGGGACDPFDPGCDGGILD